MNIFVLDLNREKNAEYHIDKHVVKMQVEAAQLLSNAYHAYPVSGLPMGLLMKISHQNHPSSLWVNEAIQNFMWLKDYMYALEAEWKIRYKHPIDREHKAVKRIRDIIDEYGYPNYPFMLSTLLTPPPLTMPDECKVSGGKWEHVVESYRNYYRLSKTEMASWKHGKIPYWFNGVDND